MKRFLIFAGENYYPSGGWADFITDADSFEDLQCRWEEATKGRQEERLYWGWRHYVDTERPEEVDWPLPGRD